MIKKIFIGVLIAFAFILLILGAVNRTLAKTNNQTLSTSQEKVQEDIAEKQSINQNLQLAKNIGNSNNTGSKGNSDQNRGGNNANQSSDCENSGQNGQGKSTSQSSTNGNSGQNGGGSRSNQSSTDENSATNGHGNNGNNSSENYPGEGEVNQIDWIDLNGDLTEIESDVWVITLSDGSQIEIEGRALSFITEQGFSASKGDQIALHGFFEDGEYKVGHIFNQRNGLEIQLRAESGQPLWSGGYGGKN